MILVDTNIPLRIAQISHSSITPEAHSKIRHL
jgi:hypothetical protein